MVSLVVDGGPVRGTASTVLDITQQGGPVIVRSGAVSRQEIEEALARGPATFKVREETA
jgi:tRNA A37 threonylcarbamoyladenosine synthetase subunit TsaC/SUA5/YrdC